MESDERSAYLDGTWQAKRIGGQKMQPLVVGLELSTHILETLWVLGGWSPIFEGCFTPTGRANSLCKRLEILTCDWLKG